MKFIDLFAGFGGFHLALKSLDHQCVFACEIEDDLRKAYKKNFDLLPASDIRDVRVTDIPRHDILCAGFPCQPFSKAGSQQGFGCPKWGDLFKYAMRIIRSHEPRYLLLENVPNLEKHDEGRTWLKIKSDLTKAGYNVRSNHLSPHLFGIPQIRERMFIVASRSSLAQFEWPEPNTDSPLSIKSILDTKPPDAKQISPDVEWCLEVWQDFLDRFPKDEELPSFPIWSMEFGATYPYEGITPISLSARVLRKYRGNHGKLLKNISRDEMVEYLPSYARSNGKAFPHWKELYIRQNREFYQKHKSWIREWLPEILRFPPSLQKFEWNCKGEKRNIWDFVIQFRASGVRVKRPTTAPSLVAMNTTQVPIIAWEKRYMTLQECARLQSMDKLEHFPSSMTRTMKALGNAVNVDLVEMIAKKLLSRNGIVEKGSS